MLQQHLPFTVLKLTISNNTTVMNVNVATALTVYGIETQRNIEILLLLLRLQQHLPFTVLKL